MADTKNDIRIYRFDKLGFGTALANYIQTVFPGETVNPGDIDQDKPIEVDPDDASLVKVTLKEKVVP
jgi:hypothetical protein